MLFCRVMQFSTLNCVLDLGLKKLLFKQISLPKVQRIERFRVLVDLVLRSRDGLIKIIALLAVGIGQEVGEGFGYVFDQ